MTNQLTVQDIMDRSGVTQTGRALAYIREALEEIALESPTHVSTARITINGGKRYYILPDIAVKILDIRCKNHDNTESLYRSIPRSIYEPETEDTDGL